MSSNKIYNLAKELWPINRSITGQGVRDTLSVIKNIHPDLRMYEVPSGSKVFDWVIPEEWNITEAWIKTPDGRKICNFNNNNLHVVGYSESINKTLDLKELNKHLHSIPSKPDAIPYITSYYKKEWGFCISETERRQLPDGEYQVYINSDFSTGSLTYGELIIPGKINKEVFLSTYICHPSMANNELSGMSVTTFLAEWIKQAQRRYTYRIIFVPETIGSITYLSRNLTEMKRNIIAGFNITCVGDERNYSYLPSRKGNTLSDEVAKHILKHIDNKFVSYNWKDRGSDERQYCSPKADLPVVSIMRTKYGEYEEYHTSLDNLENVVTPNGLQGGFNAIKLALEAIENNYYPVTNIIGEPHLSRRGLYPQNTDDETVNNVRLLTDFLTYSDGQTSLLEIANKCDVAVWKLYDVMNLLCEEKIVHLKE